MFKVLNNNIIIKKNISNEYNSNIILSKNEEKCIGIVISVKSDSVIKENDKVVFNEDSCGYFKYNNEEYLFLNERDIIAILK